MPPQPDPQELRSAILSVMSARPNRTCQRKDLPKFVLKELGILTRGAPRQKQFGKINRQANALKRQGRLEYYRTSSGNERIRMVDPAPAPVAQPAALASAHAKKSVTPVPAQSPAILPVLGPDTPARGGTGAWVVAVGALLSSTLAMIALSLTPLGATLMTVPIALLGAAVLLCSAGQVATIRICLRVHVAQPPVPEVLPSAPSVQTAGQIIDFPNETPSASVPDETRSVRVSAPWTAMADLA